MWWLLAVEKEKPFNEKEFLSGFMKTISHADSSNKIPAVQETPADIKKEKQAPKQGKL